MEEYRENIEKRIGKRKREKKKRKKQSEKNENRGRWFERDRISELEAESGAISLQKPNRDADTRLAGPAYRFGPTHAVPGVKKTLEVTRERGPLAGGLYPTGGALPYFLVGSKVSFEHFTFHIYSVHSI